MADSADCINLVRHIVQLRRINSNFVLARSRFHYNEISGSDELIRWTKRQLAASADSSAERST